MRHINYFGLPHQAMLLCARLKGLRIRRPHGAHLSQVPNYEPRVIESKWQKSWAENRKPHKLMEQVC